MSVKSSVGILARLGGDIRACSVEVELLTKECGLSKGDGAEFVDGQLRVKPAGSSFDGLTRKLKELTPS